MLFNAVTELEEAFVSCCFCLGTRTASKASKENDIAKIVVKMDENRIGSACELTRQASYITSVVVCGTYGLMPCGLSSVTNLLLFCGAAADILSETGVRVTVCAKCVVRIGVKRQEREVVGWPYCVEGGLLAEPEHTGSRPPPWQWRNRFPPQKKKKESFAQRSTEGRGKSRLE